MLKLATLKIKNHREFEPLFCCLDYQLMLHALTEKYNTFEKLSVTIQMKAFEQYFSVFFFFSFFFFAIFNMLLLKAKGLILVK